MALARFGRVSKESAFSQKRTFSSGRQDVFNVRADGFHLDCNLTKEILWPLELTAVIHFKVGRMKKYCILNDYDGHYII